VTERGHLKPFKTFTQNHLLQFVRDVKNLDVKPYDLVISDFEPVSAWAAKTCGKASIAISHQAAFNHAVPKVSGELAAKMLMKVFAPTQYSLGLHWHHFDQPILPPLIEKLEPQPVKPNKILVYMGFESVDDIVDFLEPFTDYRFHVYAKVEQKRDLGHITVEPLSHEGFHRDLLDTSGVISNAGFELASECISLGKKLLVKPLLGQYEQLCNALALQALQRGTVIKSLDKNMLGKWLKLPQEKPTPYPDVAEAIAQWIIQGDFSNSDELVQKLWAQSSIKTPEPNSYSRHIIHGLLN
jgi:uncharacterized protein (TIGR00661 family)